MDKSDISPEDSEKLTELVKAFEVEIAALRDSANKQVGTIKDLLTATEDVARVISEIKPKVENEARLAFEAKKYVEEHSNFITKSKGEVEASLATIGGFKKSCDEQVQAIENARKAIDELQTKATTTGSAIERMWSTIGETNTRINAESAVITSRRVETDKIADEVKAAVQKAKADQEALTTARTSAETSLTNIQAAVAAINENQNKSNTLHAGISEHLKNSKERFDTIAEIVEKAKTTDAKVKEYEAALEQMNTTHKLLVQRIEGLLPGAASASLATAFERQKKRFERPQYWWVRTFIASIAVIFGIAVWSVVKHVNNAATPDTWDSILLTIVQRIPLLIPPVWLAIYAGRQYMLALRMEEEYGYKEAVSIAFEGYKREMASIPLREGDHEPPLNTFCVNVLKALAERPGRIYETPQKDITPLNEVADGVSTIVGSTPKSPPGV